MPPELAGRFDYQDAVCYDLSDTTHIFRYDFLENLGETLKDEHEPLWIYNTLYEEWIYPRTENSKYWLSYQGRFGTWWSKSIPFFEDPATKSPPDLYHNNDWNTFQIDYGFEGFGNADETIFGIIDIVVSVWINHNWWLW